MIDLEVKDTNWPAKALQRLYESRKKGKMCDVFIKGSDGLTMAANSHVLRATSPVLDRKLMEQPSMVYIESIASIAWEHLLKFMYLGEVLECYL